MLSANSDPFRAIASCDQALAIRAVNARPIAGRWLQADRLPESFAELRAA